MEEELKEVFVDDHGGFVETLRPAGEILKDYFHQLQVDLPRGFRTEVNIQAVNWIKTVSASLEKGFVLTIDYGHPSTALYSHVRNTGTLACYHRHRINYCPYEYVGEQDITTHVNFSALQCWGQHAGLEYCGYTSQAFFLQGLGLVSRLRKMEEEAKKGSVAEREKMLLVNTFLMNMGTHFKVLIQRKGIRPSFLSGLQFTQRLV
jgi:SAM-dependent MidA family methyltransferase